PSSSRLTRSPVHLDPPSLTRWLADHCHNGIHTPQTSASASTSRGHSRVGRCEGVKAMMRLVSFVFVLWVFVRRARFLATVADGLTGPASASVYCIRYPNISRWRLCTADSKLLPDQLRFDEYPLRCGLPMPSAHGRRGGCMPFNPQFAIRNTQGETAA